MKILLLDNYDSFTFNLLHYLNIAGAEVTVVRNLEINRNEMLLQGFDAAVISPGPGSPAETPNLMKFVQHNFGTKPILGVCLGMQAMGIHCNWNLSHAPLPVHGKSSKITHKNGALFTGIPNPMVVGRYHSLIIKNSNGDSQLITEAVCGDIVMAVSGKKGLIWGVQFHPESILTPYGQALINNWVALVSQIG